MTNRASVPTTAGGNRLNHSQRAENETLAAASEILRRRMLRLGSLKDPMAATDFLRVRLGGNEQEVFYVLYLDSRHRIVADEVAFTGTIDRAEIYPREILKRAMAVNAVSGRPSHYCSAQECAGVGRRSAAGSLCSYGRFVHEPRCPGLGIGNETYLASPS